MERAWNISSGGVEYLYKETDQPETVYTHHCHQAYEIYCLVSGKVEFRVEGEVFHLTSGSALLLDFARLHSAKAEGHYERAVLHFPKEVLYRQELPLLKLFSEPGILYHFDSGDLFHKYLSEFTTIASMPEDVRDIAIHSHVVSLLLKFSAMCDEATVADRSNEQIKRIVKYINENLSSELSEGGIANTFYMSLSTLIRQFKKTTGVSAPKYILYKRMSLARAMLERGVPAGEVALRCGYNDYSTFYRSYRKVHGLSPGQMLNYHKKEWGPKK